MKALLAVNRIGVIGLGNGIPWKSSEDLKHFKALTLDTICLVGRKTYEALPPLKGRKLVVVGKGRPYYFKSIDEALKETPDWIIGGKTIYEQTLHLCDELHLSIINDYSLGDVVCPDLSKFTGEIFIYNFEVNKPIITEFKNPATTIISNEILPAIEETIKLAEKWNIYLQGLDKYPQMNIVCRNEILEQQLMRNGMTKEQAAKYPRTLSCPCPNCSPQKCLL